MVNFGPLAAEICWRVWGTPANFSGFRVLSSLLQWRHSPAANQTLHDVWPSSGLVHYIYIFRGSCPPDRILHGAKFQVSCLPILAALLHGTRAVCISETATLSRGRQVYSAGRPSCWTSAHILVLSSFFFPRLFLAAADWMSTILLHMVWPQCKFRMLVWNVLHMRFAGNAGRKNSPKIRHLGTIAQFCWTLHNQGIYWQSEKLVKQEYLPHTSPQYG